MKLFETLKLGQLTSGQQVKVIEKVFVSHNFPTELNNHIVGSNPVKQVTTLFFIREKS